MGNCMRSKWFETTDSKILHLTFFIFFETITDNNHRNSCYLENFLPKPMVKKLKRINVYPKFKDNIWAADLA